MYRRVEFWQESSESKGLRKEEIQGLVTFYTFKKVADVWNKGENINATSTFILILQNKNVLTESTVRHAYCNF